MDIIEIAKECGAEETDIGDDLFFIYRSEIIQFAQRIEQPHKQRIAELEQAPAIEPAQSGWLRAIDEALVCHHIDVANADDDYATAKDKLNKLLCVVQDIGAYFAKQEQAQAEDQSDSSIQLAKMIMSDCGVSDNCESLVNRIAGRIDAALNPAQAVPVARIVTIGGYPDDSQHTVEWLVKHKNLREGQLLYTHRAPLDSDTRKPLTDDDISDCMNIGIADYSTIVGKDEILKFARAIERKIGEQE